MCRQSARRNFIFPEGVALVSAKAEIFGIYSIGVIGLAAKVIPVAFWKLIYGCVTICEVPPDGPRVFFRQI